MATYKILPPFPTSMIVSHKHRYVFIEIPQTGCTAVSRELRENYDGESVLYKHATYNEFLSIANKDERKYFPFGGVRNPLEVLVSQYEKYKSNHKQAYTRLEKRQENGGDVTPLDIAKFRLVHEQGADFAKFFSTFFTSTYNNYYLLLHSRFRYMMRFENLANDFEKVLAELGIESQRPLPHVNKTEKADKIEFWEHYTPEIQNAAVQRFGPYMQKWGYSFPEPWEHRSIYTSSWLRFQSMDMVSGILARCFNISPHSCSPAVRKVREAVRKVWG